MDRYKGNKLGEYVYKSQQKNPNDRKHKRSFFRKNTFKQKLHNSFQFENIHYVTKLLMKKQSLLQQ